MSKLPKNNSDKLENLLVGIDTSDDAAVYKISEDTALIQSLDFFTPMVDDPYTFGQIAAANALSDIYAMGGEPIVSMNIACFPSCENMDVLSDILRGGFDKVKESGGLLVGGHTVDDQEPKYGLSVLGVVHPDKVLANSSAKPGDALVLTKPLGAGIMNTAMKVDLLNEEESDFVVEVMTHLNKYAAMSFSKFPINSVTDVTGFGMIGHAVEMAKGSEVTLVLDSKKVPTFDRAEELASMGMVPGGAYRNREYVKEKVHMSEDVSNAMSDILYDPQTSGGLLVSLPKEYADSIVKDMLDNGSITAEVVGEVVEKRKKYVEVY